MIIFLVVIIADMYQTIERTITTFRIVTKTITSTTTNNGTVLTMHKSNTHYLHLKSHCPHDNMVDHHHHYVHLLVLAVIIARTQTSTQTNRFTVMRARKVSTHKLNTRYIVQVICTALHLVAISRVGKTNRERWSSM